MTPAEIAAALTTTQVDALNTAVLFIETASRNYGPDWTPKFSGQYWPVREIAADARAVLAELDKGVAA